ncbi:hypothetical protein DPMN_028762 [Dreissena polymorpha]|uniref:Uncharacterized protein n=1 Tax=Dreissena polymorpha TaxID=45954 RepID=A0A9D4LWV9_DREPO|nr:hypothetical protein DPMN_028762 [Dreissena polymorpha]
MRVLRVQQHVLQDMIEWAPKIVVVVLGGNDISTTEAEKNSLEHCPVMSDNQRSGVPQVVVAGLCRRWQFREAALDAAQFVNIQHGSVHR